MQDMLEQAMADRVAKGAAFLDKHYPNWWQHIDLGTLSIASCQECVLGQVYGRTSESERVQIVAQAFEFWRPRTLTDDEAWDMADTDNHYSLMTTAYEQLSYGGAVDHGFAWDSFMEERQAPVLTDAWTTLIIQRRLDAHADVVLEFSKVDRIEKELVTA